VVHHGGAGTTHAALGAGVPNVVCPFFADQPFWARQVERLGVGKRLDFIQVSGKPLKEALEMALMEPVVERAAALGLRLNLEDGTARACEVLEGYLS
jgi:sterol 3beta-glucosyltransferase